MGLFQLLPKTGEHQEPDSTGKMIAYGPGDTVESDSNLVKRFPGKFVRLDVDVRYGKGQPVIPVPHRFIREAPKAPVGPVVIPDEPNEPGKVINVDPDSIPETQADEQTEDEKLQAEADKNAVKVEEPAEVEEYKEAGVGTETETETEAKVEVKTD